MRYGRRVDRPLAVALDPPATTASYGLKVTKISGTALQLDFSGISGRNPQAAGDFVALWQNSGSVPWNLTAQSVEPIPNTTPDGSFVFGHLKLGALPYVVGYSVGSDPSCHGVAAVVPLGLGGTPGVLQAITLTIASVGSTSLALNYVTPIGAQPETFGHQIVLVGGQTFLPSSTVLARTTPSDDSSDTAFFNGVTMVTGQWYTAAYLTGSTAATVAATATFQVTPAATVASIAPVWRS